MSPQNIFHVLSILLTGLLAGLFYGYDCSVIRGLGKLNDKEYLNAFQQINREILNPYFFASFMGSVLVLPVASWLLYKDGSMNAFYFLLSAALIYIILVFGVTMFANVPLNNMVDKADLANASAETIQSLRQQFESSWNKWHHVRTYASIIAFLLAILSLFKKV
jgi:uncharacterized membrane protein